MMGLSRQNPRSGKKFGYVELDLLKAPFHVTTTSASRELSGLSPGEADPSAAEKPTSILRWLPAFGFRCHGTQRKGGRGQYRTIGKIARDKKDSGIWQGRELQCVQTQRINKGKTISLVGKKGRRSSWWR